VPKGSSRGFSVYQKLEEESAPVPGEQHMQHPQAPTEVSAQAHSGSGMCWHSLPSQGGACAGCMQESSAHLCTLCALRSLGQRYTGHREANPRSRLGALKIQTLNGLGKRTAERCSCDRMRNTLLIFTGSRKQRELLFLSVSKSANRLVSQCWPQQQWLSKAEQRVRKQLNIT